MRALWLVAAAVTMAGCSGSGPTSTNPGTARFVGMWEGAAAGRAATLQINSDQSSRLSIKPQTGRATERFGRCNPGSDTLSFVEENGRSVVIFATRPDGSLVGDVDGVRFRLVRN